MAMGARTSQSRMNPSASGLEAFWSGASIAPMSATCSMALIGMAHSCISVASLTRFSFAPRAGAERLSAAENLAVQDGIPGIGMRGPAAPSLCDLAQLVLCREAFADGLTGDRRLGHAIGPQPAPPRAVVGRCEAPHRRAGAHLVEARGVRPGQEESASVGLACVAPRDRAVQREPASNRG